MQCPYPQLLGKEVGNEEVKKLSSHKEKEICPITCQVDQDKAFPFILHLPSIIAASHENAIHSWTALSDHAKIATPYIFFVAINTDPR